jgi:hypothetical protein
LHEIIHENFWQPTFKKYEIQSNISAGIFRAGGHGSEISLPKKTTKDTRQAASWSVRAPEEWRQQQPMAKMISLFGSVSSSRSELMRVGEVQCHWLTLNEAFMACSQVRSCRAPSPSRITGYIMGTLDIPTRGHS